MIITAVVVTYNRKDYLKKLLELYDYFIDKPDNIIIVNNNSDDGTCEILNEWINKKSSYSKHVINMNENLGGSGGFYNGIKKALDINSDWIYVSDDDAYPNKDVFKIFNDFIEVNKDILDDIAAICGTVINCGDIDIEHRRRIKKGRFFIKEYNVDKEEYNNNFELNLFSYVGTMINSKYLKKFGLTEKDYFIYYDDTEHSLRLNKYGKIICIPRAGIVHDTKKELNGDISWKTYYGYRNRLLMIKKHYEGGYFIRECILDRLKSFKRIIKGNFDEARLINKGIKDATNNIKGIDKIYKPGWKVE